MRIDLSLVVVFACTLPNIVASAQTEPYDPYAPVVDLQPPVSADGKLHWPTFFKSQKMEMRYQSLWSLGACRGSNKQITGPVERNKVNIDEMPESAADGTIASLSPQMLELVEPSGARRTIVTHPAGVSRVRVTGDVTGTSLKPGELVTFVGEVNDKGVGVSPIESLEVRELPRDFEYEPVEAGARRRISARVIAIKKQRLQLRVDAGTIRTLTVQLGGKASVHFDAKSLDLAAPGDRVHALGHVYDAPSGKNTVHLVFASDIAVEKAVVEPRRKSPGKMPHGAKDSKSTVSQSLAR